MRLTVFNGSPRARKSNTEVLLGQLRAGFEQSGDHQWEIHYLASTAKREEQVAAFAAAETVLLAFPLYVDAMPGQVKDFIEALAPLVGRPDLPALACFVHSGFPEALHSRPVEAYLQKLARRLGCRYLGTAIRGGSEGIQVMPPLLTRKLYRLTHELGAQLGRTGTLDPTLLRKLAGRERFGPGSRWVARLAIRFGSNGYWDRQLKANGAWDQRFDRPLAR